MNSLVNYLARHRRGEDDRSLLVLLFLPKRRGGLRTCELAPHIGRIDKLVVILGHLHRILDHRHSSISHESMNVSEFLIDLFECRLDELWVPDITFPRFALDFVLLGDLDSDVGCIFGAVVYDGHVAACVGDGLGDGTADT